MKFLPLVLLLIIVGAGFFMRSQQPKDWNKLLDSLRAPGDAPSPTAELTPDGQPITPAKREVEYITPSTTKFVSTAHVADVPQPNQPGGSSTGSTPEAPKVFVPPNPLPSQPAWVWTTPDGTVYNNVIIEKVEADRVTIFHSKGSAVLNIADLSPDIQRMLNYDPNFAAQAALERSATPAAATNAAPAQ